MDRKRTRKLLAGALVALLAACIPSSEPPRRTASRPVKPDLASTDRNLRQCLATLEQDGVRFSRLPDRRFDTGCTATGSVQLLDIGTPVTNLGAMKCGLAQVFASWTRDAVQPAARVWLDSQVVRLESFGTYSCRGVNGQLGGRLSEHGRANAVDIAAFVLADGRRITVLDGWNGEDADVRNFLRAVHQSGCRRFQVTLGPNANAQHRNHFHFDMGAGPYCR